MVDPDRRASHISREVANVVLGKYKRQRLSQADLVARTGITSTTMRRLIAGEAEFNVDQLWLIASALEASAADILREAELSVAESTRWSTQSHERNLPHAATADPELDADERAEP